jgi:hypothetical protein
LAKEEDDVTAVRTLRSGALTRVLMLAVSAALVPLPSAAAEESASARSSEAQPSISAVLARELPMPGARAGTLDPSSNGEVPLSRVIARDLVPARSSSNARRSDQGSSAADSPAFFKTPTGAVVLAVMVVGTAYAIYSAQHDRITSPGKN